MGYRGRRGRYPGNGPFRDLPPWRRPGWVYGYGRGYGLGYGLGYGRAYGYTGDPTKCVRFPWLPRWWWANPDYKGTVPVPTADASAAAPTFAPAPDERSFLQDQTQYLEQELAAIRKRLEELGSEEKD